MARIRSLKALLALAGFYVSLLCAAPSWAHSPQRIVAIGPSITEMVSALGLKKRLVGVCSYCTSPAFVARLPKVGGAQDLNEEALVALRPNLILTVEGDSSKFSRLARLTGARLQVLPTRHLTDIWHNIMIIGQLTGESEASSRLVARLEAGVRKLTLAPKHRKKALYMVWNQPLMIASNDSYLGDLLTLAGATNACAPGGRGGAYPVYSWEALLAADPDVILAPAHLKGALSDLIRRYPQLKAVRSGRVRTLPDDLISRPGPRVVQALAAVEQALR